MSVVATVVVQSEKKYDNKERLKSLSDIVESINADIFVFPAGWFSEEKEKVHHIYDWAESEVMRCAKDSVICVGIDGRVQPPYWSKDQVAATINKEGIIALARKFHSAPTERGRVELAEDYKSLEHKKPKIFSLNGKTFFPAVCYDSFGIRQKKLENPGIDIILNHIHAFYPSGEGNSGEVYFAKHGVAGASKQWNCPVFSSTVFFNRKIPPNWPTGILWNQGEKNTVMWKYSDNPITSASSFEIDISEGLAKVRVYEI